VSVQSFVPSGATRVLTMIGSPIGQVRSPAVLNGELRRRGIDAVLVPVEIPASALDAFFDVLRGWRNSPGVIVTVPHKIEAAKHADELSDRARLLGAVNMVRRRDDGWLEGDMVDGAGFLAAMAEQGITPLGKSVAIFGGGAVGRALLLALCEAGASRVAFHEPDAGRGDALLRLAAQSGVSGHVTLDAARSLVEADIAVNASPRGMWPDDALPFDPLRLRPGAHVADVVTEPELTPLLEIARRAGLTIQTGRAMAEAQRDIQMTFFGLDASPATEPVA
jgi:shikimate dehydrogenase